MGKVTMGSSNLKAKVEIKSSPQPIPEVQTAQVDPIIKLIEVPVERIVERVVEVPVIQEKIIEVIKEVPVIQEKVIIQEVMVPVERTVFIDRPVEVVREVKIIDIEKLMFERERVRLLQRSNAILRVAIISLVMLSFLVVGVIHG